MERGYNGIYLTSAFNSWVCNVRTTNADSGILTYNSASLTSQDIVTERNRPAHYGVHIEHAGSNHQNLIDKVTLYVEAKRIDDRVRVTIYDGSGAGYWQPGHGAFNTAWNLKVLVTSGASSD